MSELPAAVGLTIDELWKAKTTAVAYLENARTRKAILELNAAAPAIARGSRDALHAGAFKLLSAAGRAVLISGVNEDASRYENLDDYLRLLADPVTVRDLSVWALFFACREASDALQLDNCPVPTSESHLSGQLLGALGAACDRWRKVVEAPLDRYGSHLFLQTIDLSILGGEQATGGDFGLIVDLDGNSVSVQSGEDDTFAARGRRITPFILQAKRYVRPDADVSQCHWQRGYQRHLLARNDCASAYILYENGTKPLKRTLPPIVKPVEVVDDVNHTNALTGGYDLATYLITRLVDPVLAPNADSPGDALRMIYVRGYPARLAIIASDRRLAAIYEAELAELARELQNDRGEEGLTITT